MSQKKYIYFPVVRRRYKNKGRFIEEQHEFDNLDDVYLFLKLYLRNCCWYCVPVLDVSVDRDRYHGKWIFCRNADEHILKLPLYLQDVRRQAIKNARLGIELPY